MTVSEKIKTIDNKIEQNKSQYNRDRQTTKISTYVGKYELLAGKHVLLEEGLLENAAAIKRFEYSP